MSSLGISWVRSRKPQPLQSSPGKKNPRREAPWLLPKKTPPNLLQALSFTPLPLCLTRQPTESTSSTRREPWWRPAAPSSRCWGMPRRSSSGATSRPGTPASPPRNLPTSSPEPWLCLEMAASPSSPFTGRRTARPSPWRSTPPSSRWKSVGFVFTPPGTLPTGWPGRDACGSLRSSPSSWPRPTARSPWPRQGDLLPGGLRSGRGRGPPSPGLDRPAR